AAAIVYPAEARAEGVQGRVFVQFVVDETGTVQDPVCMRSPDDRLCQAAIDAVTAVSFEPGRQRGRAVKVRFTLPIQFALDTEQE
ncbi:MAG: energy transducer TonB, partial [Bacteroidota bacterium]